MSEKWLKYDEVKEHLFRGKCYLVRQGNLVFIAAGKSVSVPQANIDKYYDESGPAHLGYENCLFQELSEERRRLLNIYGLRFWDYMDGDRDFI